MAVVSVRVQFGGGLELLFGKQTSHRVVVPSLVPSDNIPSSPTADEIRGEVDGQPEKMDGQKPADISYLIRHLEKFLLKERSELFVENGTVRPGILVLVNDTDWELEGEGSYVLQENDEVVFISTLHGG